MHCFFLLCAYCSETAVVEGAQAYIEDTCQNDDDTVQESSDDSTSFLMIGSEVHRRTTEQQPVIQILGGTPAPDEDANSQLYPHQGELEEEAVCLNGKAVPRLYLLGHEKCSTTTAAIDWFNAGAESGFDVPVKELHSFEAVCKYVAVDARTQKELSGEVQINSCPAAQDEHVSKWLNSFPWRNCKDGKLKTGTLLDGTPSNVVIPGLPQFMAKLYAPHTNRLAFVLMLREPLSRMQSAFYYEKQLNEAMQKDPLYSSFATWTESIESKLNEHKENGWKDIHLDYSVDAAYRGLYSLNMAPWLTTFAPHQFLILPMNYYTGSVNARRNVLKLLADKFRVTVSPEWGPSDLTDDNADSHPSLQQDLSLHMITLLNDKYFGPDLWQLAANLAHVDKDITIAGYAGPGDAESIHSHLRTYEHLS